MANCMRLFRCVVVKRQLWDRNKYGNVVAGRSCLSFSPTVDSLCVGLFDFDYVGGSQIREENAIHSSWGNESPC
jgi:hypothetical protein